MKRALFLMTALVILVMPFFAHAALPPHVEGAGLFTFKSSVPAAASKKAAEDYAKKIHDLGFSYVILKSHDGDHWGTIVVSGGKKVWRATISKDLVKAFHDQNMRVYSYFTARLNHDRVIDASIKLAGDTLDMGVDGVMIDDLELFGKDPKKWTRAFVSLRQRVNAHKGTILLSSTHPHHTHRGQMPNLWRIAFQYSDYFVPQEYWMEFVAGSHGKKTFMTPEAALAYGQAQFDIVKTRYPDTQKCQLLPAGRTYGKNVTAAQVNTFLKAALPFYKSVMLFVYEKEPPRGGWTALSQTLKSYNAPGRTVQPISLVDRFNNPPKLVMKHVPTKRVASKPVKTSSTRVAQSMKKPPAKHVRKRHPVRTAPHPAPQGGGWSSTKVHY